MASGFAPERRHALGRLLATGGKLPAPWHSRTDVSEATREGEECRARRLSNEGRLLGSTTAAPEPATE